MTAHYIAEIASAHEGNPDRILQICDRITVRPDVSIKLQVFVAKELCASSNPDLDVFKKLQISFDVWDQVVSDLRGKGFNLFVEPYGRTAWEWALDDKSLDLKISGSELTPSRLQIIREECCTNHRDVIVGLAGSTQREIDRVTSALNDLDFLLPYLQVGFQAFPTATSDLRIGKGGGASSNNKLKFAYADHTDGGQYDKGLGICGAALALGYRLIEKHVTINREARGTDFFSSINAEEFDTFCSYLRDIDIAINNPFDSKMSCAELEYRLKFKKYLVASGNISSGDVIDEDSCDLLRVDLDRLGHEGVSSFDFHENLMLGRAMFAKAKITKGSIVKFSDVGIHDG